VRAVLLLLVAGLGACAGDKPQMADSGRAIEVRIADTPLSAIGTKAPCPATGLWQECSAFERLDRAGLAPRRDTSRVTEAPLTAQGHLIRVGNSELELYFYPDEGGREREAGRIDRAKYVAYDEAMPLRPLPTLIQSANLIAILHSRNDHQRERVGDALSAGPPQPSRP
jgi:hypothetical protein